MTIQNRWVPALALMGLAATAPGCATDETDKTDQGIESSSQEVGTTNWWENERAQRQAAFDQHLVDHADNFAKYRSMPAGTVGVPAIIFRLFPYVMPQLWGPPESNFAVLGLMTDDYAPDAVLPLGLGHIAGSSAVPTPQGDVHMRVVGMTCATCHTGRVALEDGSVRALIGAPATEFKYNLYRGLLYATVNHPDFEAATFVAALDALPLGWLYNDPNLVAQEAAERAVFKVGAAQMLAAVKASVTRGAQHTAATLGRFTYDTPNAPDLSLAHPGQMDAMGGFATMTVDPSAMSDEYLEAVLPPRPAMIDQMYLWNIGDRPNTKWGGEVIDPTHSLAGAAMGMIGTPEFVHMEAINASAEFAWELPPTPYPFAVEREKAARGQRLFNQHCADCHAPGNDNLLTPAEVGTDGNRAIVFTDHSINGLRQLIRIACNDPVTCTDADGDPIPGDHVMRNTGGYAALPLDGIWARAPYLHNGSVPTLRALLTGDRPTTFYRGNINYDQNDVGFVSDAAHSPHAQLYDTTLDGNSNVGHDSAEFTGGIDWANEPRKLEALIEYMKTL